MPLNVEVRSKALLRGAIDTHIHTAPDIYPRSVTVVEAAKNARAAGMRAILVKSHCNSECQKEGRYMFNPLEGGFPFYKLFFHYHKSGRRISL